jgi:hypothetical protein
VAEIATIAKSASIQNGEICVDPVEQTAQLLAARNRQGSEIVRVNYNLPLVTLRDRVHR